MKIEIGESLFYSWLRHVKNCRIVQTNWKSSSTWTIHHQDELEQLYNKALIEFSDCLTKEETTKKETALSQFLKQAEIDIIGKSEDEEFYVVDVAFHKNGCHYKSNEVIAKKLIRSAFCLYGYFGSKKGNIIFATPKFNPTPLKHTEELIERVKKFLSDNDFSFEVECICNEDFYSKVVFPVTEQCEDNSDTAELFMRAYDLYKLTSKDKNQPIKSQRKARKINSNTSENTGTSVLKIGKMVRKYLITVLKEGKITAYELQKLKEDEYSKQIFGINYPLLSKERFINKRPRYYANRVLIDNEEYYICQEWYETSRQKLKDWLENHGVIIED